MSEIDENLDLTKEITPENPMKSWLVQYVGEKMKPEDGSVNTFMIVEAMAQEFPEFVLVLAEENFIRGYKQALYDIDYGSEEENISTPE